MALKFLKQGKEARDALKRADEDAAALDEEIKNRVYRYRLPQDAEGKITFIDGDLDEDGLLEINMYYEHNLQIKGSWNHWFVCVQDTEVCPLCDAGMKHSLVGAFTVIDHSVWKDQQGKTHRNERRLFVAKRETLKYLQKIATKRGGLAGCTFETLRTGEKSPSVGNVFEFVSKKPMATIQKLYKEAVIIDYELAISYKTAKQLRALGYGEEPVGSDEHNYKPKSKVPAPTYGKKPAVKKTFGGKAKTPDYDDDDDVM